MPPEWQQTLQAWFVALSTVFFLVDPFAAIPSFLVFTEGYSPSRRLVTARRASLTCFGILMLFAIAGTTIFKIFGVTLPAFKIAGGFLLAFSAFDMLQARHSRTQETQEEIDEGRQLHDMGQDAGIMPLGMPILAGPGSISAVMVLAGGSGGFTKALPVYVAIGITSLGAYLLLSQAGRVRAVLGETGINILMRLMGLVLAALAVQFVIDALRDLKVIPAA